MKTPLQELIEWGDEMLMKYPQKNLGFAEVIDKAESLLPKEKEHILQSHIDGQKNEGFRSYQYEANKYFEEKYKGDSATSSTSKD
jgi:hypothetical protein